MNTQSQPFRDSFSAADEVAGYLDLIQEKFNARRLTLLDLSPHQRIFLLFFAKSIKTFSAISFLCKEGYIQDCAPLLRNLLENLISVRYILYDAVSADKKAARFVDYKWVILKRYYVQDTVGVDASASEENILNKCKEFKEKYGVTSDKTLITWSGRSVRDMAKCVDRELLKEYDSTFRLCSRFSHPSIIGDKEYFHYGNNVMMFSSAPSVSGIVTYFEKAVRYVLDFLELFNGLFALDEGENVQSLRKKIDDFFRRNNIPSPQTLDESSIVSDRKKGEQIFIQFGTFPQK